MASPPPKEDSIPPSSSSSTEYHPALSVNNIRNAIPLILDYENVQYSDWVELFENHVCAYDVLDHIDPKTVRPSGVSDSLWKRLDAIVKQWIYGTISPELLKTILSRHSTAQQTWDRIKQIFQDNKSTRAVYLENQFNMLHLSQFPNITAYCRQVKSLADQLANIDHPISEPKLVLRLVSGLVNTDYDTVATMIQQTDPLPSFQTCRSRLLLEETRRANDPTTTSQSFITTEAPTAAAPSINSPSPSQSSSSRGGHGGKNSGRGGGGRNSRGRGRGRGRFNGNNTRNNNPNNNFQQQQQQSTFTSPQWPTIPLNNWAQPQWFQQAQWPSTFPWPQGWTSPPCPFPTAAQRPSHGLLGPAPRGPQPQQQAHAATHGSPMTPTELGNAFSTMQLTQHDDAWYMDSGATSHMTNNPGSTYGDTHSEMQ